MLKVAQIGRQMSRSGRKVKVVNTKRQIRGWEKIRVNHGHIMVGQEGQKSLPGVLEADDVGGR